VKLRIIYTAQYRYEAEVSFSQHVFRLFPKPDHYIRCEGITFTTNEGADVQHRRDLFDNNIASCFYPERGTDLVANLELELRLQEKNAFHFLLETRVVHFPFQYSAEETRLLAPYLDGPTLHLPFWAARPQPTLEALVGLSEAICRNIGYERREEGTAFAPHETIARGRGACRDLAVLLAAVLRTCGIASRLASGYLCELDAGNRRAAGSLHAWTEAYLPGAGWVGLDPTNGLLCNHNHITTAVGLTPDDIAPVSGSYFADAVVPSEMIATLEMLRGDE
jgi:transglutaminase-like putative cysteine protease